MHDAHDPPPLLAYPHPPFQGRAQRAGLHPHRDLAGAGRCDRRHGRDVPVLRAGRCKGQARQRNAQPARAVPTHREQFWDGGDVPRGEHHGHSGRWFGPRIPTRRRGKRLDQRVGRRSERPVLHRRTLRGFVLRQLRRPSSPSVRGPGRGQRGRGVGRAGVGRVGDSKHRRPARRGVAG